MQKAMLILAATLAAFLSVGGVSDAAEIRGRVVRIADGDTLTILSPATGTTGVPPVAIPVSTGTTGVSPVANTAPLGQRASCPLPASPTQHKIRLHGIDAPESHQAFGHKSKQHLSSLVFGKDVRVKYRNRDKYGRILGTVYVDCLDINLEMLRVGLAWHYKRFDSTPAYAAAESEARQNRRGLWSDSNPTPPEQFRHASSNKRHNRKCENYRKTRGYPCSKGERNPCGKCGG